MSDWEIVQNNEKLSSPKIEQSSDWEMVGSPSAEKTTNESFGTSALLAIPRVGEDIYRAGMSAINNIPDYYESAKKEYPGFYKTLFNNPEKIGKQALAGLAELGQNTFNTPHNIINYLSDRLNLFPKDINQKIQMGRMPDATEDINSLLGSPSQPGEKLARGLGRNTNNLMGAGMAASLMKPSGLFTTKNKIKNTILNRHDALENRATKTFNKVSDQVNKRGINKIPLNNIDHEFFENIKQYFPNTRASTKLINDAKTGDYNALRKLQSDLYTKGKTNLGSSLEVDRMKGAEMLEKRNDVNQMISNHLKDTGHHDLDALLNEARGDWSTLQRTYYNDNMNNAIVNMVNKDFRKVPKNLISILQEESKPMQNLLDFHPELERNLNRYGVRQNIFNKGLKVGIPAATGFLGYEYGKGNKGK